MVRCLVVTQLWGNFEGTAMLGCSLSNSLYSWNRWHVGTDSDTIETATTHSIRESHFFVVYVDCSLCQRRRGYRSVANSANLHKARCGLFLRTTSTNSEHLFYRRGRVVYDVTEVRRSCSLRAPRCIESIDRDAWHSPQVYHVKAHSIVLLKLFLEVFVYCCYCCCWNVMTWYIISPQQNNKSPPTTMEKTSIQDPTN